MRILFKIFAKKLYLKELRVVLRPLWFYSLLLVLSCVALALMPQGGDMMYCIIEDTTKSKLGPLFFLLITTIFWSITLYFTAMLILWVSDLSSENLPRANKFIRRKYARNVPQFFLYFPIFLINFAFIKSFIIKELENDYSNYIILELVIVLLSYLIVKIFYASKIIKEVKNKHFTKITLFSILFFVFSFLLLIKLKTNASPTNYLGFFAIMFIISLAFIITVRYIYTYKWMSYLDKLVKNINPKYNTAPLKSVFFNLYLRNAIKKTLKNYSSIVTVFINLVFVTLFLVISINYLKITYYEIIGGISIIILSFSCWGIIYTFISLVSKIISYTFSISIKAILFVIIFFVSYKNLDHPIRFIENSNQNNSNLNIVDYFDNWLNNKYSKIDSLDSVPVIFIAAEGGAFRTGCYSAYMLNTLQKNIDDNLFNNAIFCYSTVSGGTFGCNLYNSISTNQSIPKEKYELILDEFFSHDYLSPLTAKLVFG